MIAGLDLAAKPENPSGLAILRDNSLIYLENNYSDEDILNILYDHELDVIGIDAPLTNKTDKPRACDVQMKIYGAMPLSLGGMKLLATRAVKLKEEYFRGLGDSEIDPKKKFIEVFPTGTAKILKIYSRNLDLAWIKLTQYMTMQNIKWSDGANLPLTRHGLDAVLAALSGWLYFNDLTKDIGDFDGTIIIPDTDKLNKIPK